MAVWIEWHGQTYRGPSLDDFTSFDVLIASWKHIHLKMYHYFIYYVYIVMCKCIAAAHDIVSCTQRRYEPECSEPHLNAFWAYKNSFLDSETSWNAGWWSIGNFVTDAIERRLVFSATRLLRASQITQQQIACFSYSNERKKINK